jgi:hypothetical protein
MPLNVEQMAITYHKETMMSEETILSEQEVAPEAEATTESTESTETTEVVSEGWMMSEDIKGEGDVPEWFKSSKYKTVADQAKAYASLEPKLGAFTGSPEGGYTVELPEGVEAELDAEDPMLISFNEWATEAGLSQEKHTELMALYVNGLMESQPAIEDEIKRMGKDAPQRINDFTAWAKTNFDEAEFETLQGLATTADGFVILEKMRGMLRETDVAAPNNVRPVDSTTKEALHELVADPRYETSPAFRKDVEKKFADFYGTQPQNQIRQ